MASTSWPNDTNSRQVTQVEYEGLVSGYAYDGFTNGVPTDSTPCYADGASGMVVKMRAGKTAEIRGHGYAVGDTDVSITVPANASGSTRIDRVVLELDRSGTGQWNVTEKLVQGTPGSGQPPALTQQATDTGKWQMPVAQVTVANGASAISPANVENESWYVSPTGMITCTRIPQALPVRFGLQVMESDTGRLFVGTNSAWKPQIEDSGWINCTINSQFWKVSGISPKIRRYNGVIYCSGGSMERKSGLAGTTDSSVFSWPANLGYVAATSADHRRAASYTTGAGLADVTFYPTNDPARANWCYILGHDAMSTGDVLYVSEMQWIPATDDYWGD